MKLIDSKKLENNQHELQFSIDAEALNAATEKAFKREAKKYSIPGFRKGKAPRHMIEKMYGDVFRSDAINDLFPEAYESAVAEAKIEPVAIDNVEDISEKDAADVTLKVLITVKPEVTLGDYKGLKAEKKANTVDEAEVEAEIKRMQERNARIITRDGAAEDGDITKIDFEGFVDGVAFDGGKAEDFSLTLGSGQFIPGFEEQIVGHSAGEEFDLNVKFPEEYQAEELAGKDATFKVKLHEVQAKELPQLDDEFAKDVSEHDTLDELKNNIRTGMQERAAKENELEVENSLVDQIVDGMTVNVPAAMIESRVDDMVRDFEYRLEQQGLKLQDYIKYMGNDMKKFREGFAEQAEKQVKTRLALEAVAIKEGIEATQEDFENEIKRIADAYKMEVEKVKTLIPELEVKKDLAVNKAIDFIKSHATVTEKAADKKDSDAK